MFRTATNLGAENRMGSVAVRGFAPAIFFVLLGGLLWGWIGATGRNPLSEQMGKRVWIVYALVGLSAVFVAWQGRNAFLPFLGPTVFPCAALADQTPEGANTEVVVQTRPGAKVLYWAAEPEADNTLHHLKTWRDAYAGFKNVGVTTADADGMAHLRVRGPPQSYTVPMKGSLTPHVHYRICLADGGMAQVETTYVQNHEEPAVDVPEEEKRVRFSDEVLVSPQPPMEVTEPATMSTTEPTTMPLPTPSLDTLRMDILKDSEALFDPFAFPEGPVVNGSDLEQAFAAPQKLTGGRM
jgi:uncharacterized membrane protein YuzA (DUF378 family)